MSRARLSLSIAQRLVVLAAGWSLTVLLVVGVVLTLYFQHTARTRFDIELDKRINTLQGLTNAGADGRVIPPDVTDAWAQRTFSGRYWLIYEPTAGGGWRELARSPSMGDFASLPPPPGGAAVRPNHSARYGAQGPDGQHLRIAVQQNTLPGRSTSVLFVAAEDDVVLRDDANRLPLTIVALMVLGAGLVLAVLIQVRIGLQPLFGMSREVEAVRKGRAERLDGAYPAEVAPLAAELNALLAHNQEVVERQRTHAGNLAHALKTPLSVMMAEAQRQGGPLAELVERQVEIMRGQVDHHLRRARAAARAGPGDATPLAPVIDELARTLERIFRTKGVVIDWRCPDDLAFRGERQDLQDLIGNVMENAAKWCAGKVRLDAVAEGAMLRMVVEDDGPGLPPERRAEVLRRGARLDETAPGSGLGLSIVDELARAYGGSVALEDSGLGGLKVVLILPRVT